MIDGTDQFVSIATAALLLLSIALAAPSLALMTDVQMQSSLRLRLDATVGISVLCAGISLSTVYEHVAVGFLGLACAIMGLLLFENRVGNTGGGWGSTLRLWGSAILLLIYIS